MKKSLACRLGIHNDVTLDAVQCKTHAASMFVNYGKIDAIASIDECSRCGRLKGKVSAGGHIQEIPIMELKATGYFDDIQSRVSVDVANRLLKAVGLRTIQETSKYEDCLLPD